MTLQHKNRTSNSLICRGEVPLFAIRNKQRGAIRRNFNCSVKAPSKW